MNFQFFAKIVKLWWRVFFFFFKILFFGASQFAFSFCARILIIFSAGHNDAASGDATPQDYDNYIRFLRILREAFDNEVLTEGKEKLMLTVAVGIGIETVKTAYNIPQMHQYLDYIGLMTYDMHGKKQKQLFWRRSHLFPLRCLGPCYWF